MRVALVAGLLGLLVGAAGGFFARGERPATTVTKVRTVAPPYAGADFDDDGFGP